MNREIIERVNFLTGKIINNEGLSAEENAELAREATDLIQGALRLRVNLMLAEPCLWLKWVFPGWPLSLPAVETPYLELLTYLSRIRHHRQWDLPRSVLAG